MSDGGNISLPGKPADTPGLPENFHPINFEKFETLNTKPSRPAIGAGEMFWCDGWFPIGPSNLRILPGIGPDIYTAPAGMTIVWFAFGNVGDVPYATVLLSDGSMIAVNLNTNATSTIMPAGTIASPSTVQGFTQFGSEELVFAKDQTNGYWLWDANNLFTAGGVGPEVSIANAGKNYTSLPTISFQTTGSGTSATFVAEISNGAVTKITTTNPGTGFGVDDFINLYISGGGTDDSAIATPTVSVNTGGVQEVVIVDGGHGYTSRTRVIFSAAPGSGASGAVSITNGAITAIAIINPGTGYAVPPTVSIDDPGIPGSPSIPGGSGGVAVCTVAFGQITSIGVNYGGTGYRAPPIVSIIGDGTGATAVAQMESGVVTAIIMQTYGQGYSKALVHFSGGNDGAEATTFLMPYGISGTASEVYQGRVWITNGGATASFPPRGRTIFSSAESAVDFGDNGGAFVSTDSFLRVGYHWLKQTNGFLYLGGDSSINYISGVQTSAPATTGGAASVPVTTFSNVNVDPQLGSPWPSSVQVFSRNIVFANTIGAFVSYGGAVSKASLPLDGFYFTGPIYSATANFSSAVANIFGIPVYMLLLPTIDQLTGQTVNKLLMWDGKKWFTSQQDRPLTYISTYEINSALTAWGTDGTHLFQLFAQPSTGFTKRVQSKLYADPAYWLTKTARSLTLVAQSYALDNPLTVFIDNENALGSGNAEITVTPSAGLLTWTNNVGQPIVWTNNANQPIVWGAPGLAVMGPYPVGQSGRMIGLTIETDASDLSLLSVMLSEQVYTANV